MKTVAVNLQVVHEVGFACHFEHGSLIIDKCTGISPEAGLALFDPWILEAMHDESSLPAQEIVNLTAALHEEMKSAPVKTPFIASALPEKE